MKFKDLTGQRFGRFLVIKQLDKRKNKQIMWLCKCDCGKEKEVRGNILRRGQSKSCGCFQRERASEANLKDLTGHRFGKLVCIKLHSKDKEGKYKWLCLCDCGNQKIVPSNSLQSGKTNSCGCLRGGQNRKEVGEAAFNSIIISYKKSARIRNLTYNLSNDLVRLITKQNCYYCGVAPFCVRTTPHSSSYTYNGIDRVDNSRGYEPDNVVPCCKICNRTKREMSQEEFIAWAERIRKLDKFPAGS
jgi:hypothetical protein